MFSKITPAIVNFVTLMKLKFLGTGTSTGVPVLMCGCEVCRSADPRDKRRRSAAIISTRGRNLLIDCGPDIYSQLLDAGSPPIDAVLLTHTHYDHVGGIDDLRPYCYHRSADEGDMPVFARHDVIADLHLRVPYCFKRHPYPGVPRLSLHEIKDSIPFVAAGIDVIPLPIIHDRLHILGFRFGPLAYITDCGVMPQSTIPLLEGIDTLVINALRFKPHHSHMNLAQALEVIDLIKPRQAYLTHISHQLGLHSELDKLLPQNVSAAYDGLVVNIDNL